MMVSLLLVLFVGAIALLCYYAFIYDAFCPESIAGKRVLITGASSGIGEHMAYYYSRLGASLVIAARREELLKNVAAKCKTLGAQTVEYVAVDLAVPQNRITLVQETKKRLGGLDHLILDHAILSAYLWKGSPENISTLQKQMEVNFMSYVDIASKCVDMLKQNKGSIGIVSSGMGKMSLALGASYAASKYALDGFFIAFREELRYTKTGISITIAYLGYIDTEAAIKVMRNIFPAHINDIPSPAPVAECAAAIVRGVANKQLDVVFPYLYRIVLIMHKIAPFYATSFASYLQFRWIEP